MCKSNRLHMIIKQLEMQEQQSRKKVSFTISRRNKRCTCAARGKRRTTNTLFQNMGKLGLDSVLPARLSQDCPLAHTNKHAFVRTDRQTFSPYTRRKQEETIRLERISGSCSKRETFLDAMLATGGGIPEG